MLLIKIIRILSLFLLIGIFLSNAVLQFATVLFFPLVIYLIIKNIKEKNLTVFEVLIILLFLSSIISIYLSPKPSIAVRNIVYHSILLTIIPIIYLVKNDKELSLKLFGKLFVFFALLPSAIGIIRHFGGAERAYGFYSGYYTLASLLAFTIPISLAFAFYYKDFWKYFTLFSAAVQFIALWLTFTRSALLGFLFGSLVVILILFFHSKMSRQTRRKAIISFALFLVILSSLLLTSSESRLNPLLIFSNTDVSSGRNEIYNDALSIIKTDFKERWPNLILGHGLESRIIFFPKSPYTSWESEYVETFISQGLIGLLLTVLIYFQFFKILSKLVSESKDGILSRFALALLASGTAFIVISFFSSQLIGRISSSHFVVIYAMAVFINSRSKENIQSDRNKFA